MIIGIILLIVIAIFLVALVIECCKVASESDIATEREIKNIDEV